MRVIKPIRTVFRAALIVAAIWFCGCPFITAVAQPVFIIPTDTTMIGSVDSLLNDLEALKLEREAINEELKRLSIHLRSVEQDISDEFADLRLREKAINRNLEMQFDTLRTLIPDDEPLRTATFYIRYLNQRQDSLIAYVERLESKMEELPDNHYWGIRNNFKEFDHLLLFTFLGAMMSLGLVLLLRGDNNQDQTGQTDHLSEYIRQEDKIDRLSISITLLVGSILVLLFIIFIL